MGNFNIFQIAIIEGKNKPSETKPLARLDNSAREGVQHGKVNISS